MSRFFGQSKSKTVPQPTLNDTVATLDLRRDTINKQIAAIDRDLQAYKKLSPAQQASQKSRAMALVNKKRMFEKQRNTIESQTANLGATTFAIENMNIQRHIYDGMRGANQQLANGYKDLKIEQVDNLVDDLDDHIRDQEEMNDVFSRPIGQDMYTNDADLESELAGICGEEFGVDNNIYAPSVPVHTIRMENRPIPTTRNNVQVDEYGLPRAPATGMRN